MSVSSPLVGIWRLISYEFHRDDGQVLYPLGRHVAGLLIYDASGYMSMQVMRTDLPHFRTDSEHAVDAETAETVSTVYHGYRAYCGTYEIDEEAETVTHRPNCSLMPNWIGTVQARQFEVVGSRLFLRNLPLLVEEKLQTVLLVWERAA